MRFFALIRSIVLVGLLAQPLALFLLGLADFLRSGRVDGLFAVAATPMTLAFFGVPVLLASLVVIVPTYALLSYCGLRGWVPAAVFAIGAAVLAYLLLAQPAPTGALPGYDQAAQLFAGCTLVAWALYAFFRLDWE